MQYFKPPVDRESLRAYERLVANYNLDPIQIDLKAIQRTIQRIESDIIQTRAMQKLRLEILGGLCGGGKERGKGRKKNPGAGAGAGDNKDGDNKKQGKIPYERWVVGGEGAKAIQRRETEPSQKGQSTLQAYFGMGKRVTRSHSAQPIDSPSVFHGVAGSARAQETFLDKEHFLLVNQGNQCYATSVLFLLLSIKEFRSVIITNKDCSPTCSLLFNLMRTENKEKEAGFLHSLCKSLDPLMADLTKQFDSQAFQTLLLQKLQAELTGVSLDALEQLFFGTKSVLKTCSKCSHSYGGRSEAYTHESVDVRPEVAGDSPPTRIILQQALDDLCQGAEQLEECPNPKCKMPDVFYLSQTTPLSTPKFLSVFVLRQLPKDKKSLTKVLWDNGPGSVVHHGQQYKLFGYVFHIGSKASSGHYVACNAQHVQFDDGKGPSAKPSVTKLFDTRGNFMLQTAYTIILKRVDGDEPDLEPPQTSNPEHQPLAAIAEDPPSPSPTPGEGEESLSQLTKDWTVWTGQSPPPQNVEKGTSPPPPTSPSQEPGPLHPPPPSTKSPPPLKESSLQLLFLPKRLVSE